MIGAVYLVWGPLGNTLPRRFLRSYREHPSGSEHELVLLLNNVDASLRKVLEAELDGLDHQLIELPKPMQDLAAYGEATARLEHDSLCFLNSYSTILAPNWLAKLHGVLDQSDVGLVGATGSWASVHSAVLNSFFLPNPYRGSIPKRSIARREVAAIELEINQMRAPDAEIASARRTLMSSVVSTVKSFGPMPGQLLKFPPFPSCHIRTNAFMAKRSTLTSLRMERIDNKKVAYEFESGRNSLTRRIQRDGMKTLVVDREGVAYEPEQWSLSRTFWQGDQEGLLIADNQTLTYTNGGLDRRCVLSSFAWADRADPRIP